MQTIGTRADHHVLSRDAWWLRCTYISSVRANSLQPPARLVQKLALCADGGAKGRHMCGCGYRLSMCCVHNVLANAELSLVGFIG
jgi:hypothetical protein